MKIRSDFPLLHSSEHKDLIFLDNGATTHKPAAVINSISSFYSNDCASPHRGIYHLAEQATLKYDAARAALASFINAAQPEEIVFTSGATAGVNIIATSWAELHLQPGDEIIVTDAEHHANLLPWQRAAKRKNLKLRFARLQDDFTLADPELTPRTKLLALTHCSNVLGPVWKEGQLERIITKAHEAGVRVFLDSAQVAPHKKIDVQKLNPDFLVFSGHKMMGPTGIGVLYIKKELHDEVEPGYVGGTMVYSANKKDAVWHKAPLKFEAGTVPIAQAIGLHSAVNYLIPLLKNDKLINHERALVGQLLDGLQKIEGVRVWGNQELLRSEGHVVSFTVDGLHAHDIAEYLGYHAIAVRAGHHCAQPLADQLGITASLRVSFYLYNSADEVKKFLSVLGNALKDLRAIQAERV